MKKYLLLATMIAATGANASGYNTDQTSITADLINSSYGSELGSASGVSVALEIPYTYDNSSLKSSIEFGFANLGEAEGVISGVNMKSSATSIFFASKFYFPVNDKFDVFLKGGLNIISLKADGELNGFTASAEETESRFTYGLGGQYAISNTVAVHAEYKAYAADISSVGAGVKFQF